MTVKKAAREGHVSAWAAFVRAWPVAIAVMLGVGLIYGAGFAGSEVLHDAAHDARHSFTFPCH
ncbi:MAG: CbtB domain-containing protein [Alphaproteobacteria bacterium]